MQPKGRSIKLRKACWDAENMISVYINYPNARVSAHCDANCNRINQARKGNQRTVEVNRSTLCAILDEAETTYRFESTQEYNDTWLHIEFGDQEFELAVAKHIVGIFGKRYSPFSNVNMDRHC